MEPFAWVKNKRRSETGNKEIAMTVNSKITHHLVEDNPQRLYFSIAEVADDINVEQSTLRFWEKEFKETLHPKRDPKGRRQYTAKDVKIVEQIYHLLKVEGLSVEGARLKIKNKKGYVEKEAELRNRLLAMRKHLLDLKELLMSSDELLKEKEEREEKKRRLREIENMELGNTELKTVRFDGRKDEEKENEETENGERLEVDEISEEEDMKHEETVLEERIEIVADAVEENKTEIETEGVVYTQSSLFGEEFEETIKYTPKSKVEDNVEEKEEKKQEEDDSRQLSLF